MFFIKDLQCVFGKIEIFGKSLISLFSVFCALYSALYSIPLIYLLHFNNETYDYLPRKTQVV